MTSSIRNPVFLCLTSKWSSRSLLAKKDIRNSGLMIFAMGTMLFPHRRSENCRNLEQFLSLNVSISWSRSMDSNSKCHEDCGVKVWLIGLAVLFFLWTLDKSDNHQRVQFHASGRPRTKDTDHRSHSHRQHVNGFSEPAASTARIQIATRHFE